jgi:hypothetical protein
MAAFLPESLVLRGVSVLADGKCVDLRRGTRAAVNPLTPEVPISMRHPSRGYRQAFEALAVRPDHADKDRVDDAVPGAGRSRCRAGVLSRRSPARSAGQAIQYGWPQSNGGPALAAAMLPCRLTAGLVASAGESASGRPEAVSASTSPTTRTGGWDREKRLTAGVGWCKPAARTPSASTRGKGGR